MKILIFRDISKNIYKIYFIFIEHYNKRVTLFLTVVKNK